MTIKEKMLKIIALAMSIKATDSYFLAINWNNKTDQVIICVHKHIDGMSQGVVESYIYDEVEEVTGYASYVTYDAMIERLERMKREWECNNE